MLEEARAAVRPAKKAAPRLELVEPVERRGRPAWWIKRTVDLLGAVVGGLVVSPFLLAIALLIWLESGGGPVFYADRRLGRGGVPFSCLKFRTMLPDAEEKLKELLWRDPEARAEYALYHKLRNDPRVTRVGRFLRRTSLDELPQLWNVLKGELSLVGPRPYLVRESEDLGEAREQVLDVLPGITGLWQVSGRNRLSFEERVALDLSYIRNRTTWLDWSILFRTLSCVVLRRGAC